MCVESLKVLKPAGTPPPVAVGPNGVATMPEESAWDAAAEYEVPFRAGDTMLEIAYVGDMARLYADGVLVQDDFWKGLPIRYALRRLPKGTKRLVLKVLPWGEGVRDKIYVDAAAGKPVACAPLLSGGNPDPTVCRVGDEYYIVTSSFSLSPGLPVYHSTDMVNWEIISHAWRESWPCKTPDDGIWAPTLRHHNGVFYLTVTWHDGFKKAENYLLTARDPAGPWSKPMKIDAKSGIDGSLFFDGDDAWYLSNRQPSKQKWRGHCQIWMQRIDLA